MSESLTTLDPDALAALLAGIDIQLLDQVLKGRIAPGMRVFDAGSGGGRNVAYLLRIGCGVAALDRDPAAIAEVVRMAGALAPRLPHTNFRVGLLEDLAEERDFALFADVVLCVAVLHFARDAAHFRAQLDGAFSVLRPGGLFFARLASTVGQEGVAQRFGGGSGVGRYGLADGTERFLVDEAFLAAEAARLGAVPVEPLKSTVVHGARTMTTWVLKKLGDQLS